ncbi:MAG: single-stranded-DNA-specific exonuclease RecJ [Dethiobacter sp.]|nr:single-stranded-DNA-specific exonuclease RecJ [Dethiobacter sp.]
MSYSWRWTAAKADQDAVRILCDSLGIQHITAACLIHAGIDTPGKAELFLNGGLENLADPFAMAGMRDGVERLSCAVKQCEPVLVYGDYDADGVTSTAVLTCSLRSLGVSAEYYIPSRLKEGYGLHAKPLEEWAARGGRLVVSADCGSNDFTQMQLAAKLGVDLIITDHHLVAPGERPVTAFINPRQPGCGYAEKELAGVGVAWNLIRALHRQLGLPEDESTSCLDLVAIGTIADVVTLLGENRILVRHGLNKLRHNPLPGIAALARRAGLDAAGIGAHQVAFALSPRLNASGRLGDAAPSAELLLAEEAEKAESLAEILEEANGRRRQVESEILAQAQVMAAEQAARPALVLWNEGWHAGVVGIVAGRLADEYSRPVVLIALSEEEGRGSARSVPGFDLMSMLSECADRLLRFGGHKEAAGLAIAPENLAAFREDFCQSAAAFSGPDESRYQAAAEVGLNDLSLALARELELLQPFGQGNPDPVFLARSVKVVSSRLVGSRRNHLQLRLQKDSPAVGAIRFGINGELMPKAGEIIDCAFTLQENSWQGRSNVSLHLRDMRSESALAMPGIAIDDRRQSKERDTSLAGLAAAGQRLLVFVNTKNTADLLKKQFPAELVTVSHRGLAPLQGSYDALVFYHLPYDRSTVEQMLSSLDFKAGLRVHILFDREDLTLNERIFTASIPGPEVLQALLPCLERAGGDTVAPEALKEQISFTPTRYLLTRSLAILRELGIKEPVPWTYLKAKLNHSLTYTEGREILSAFRRYQSFWLLSDTAQLSSYLKQPENFSLPEGVAEDESGRFERAN